MKNKYTLTVANAQINIITDESKETIDAIVGVVDRQIREVYLHGKGECSRTNAAILVCLDYCAEKLELQKTVKNLNTELEHLTVLNEAAEREKAALERELAALREALSASASQHKLSTRRAHIDQIAFDEMNAVEPTPAAQEPTPDTMPKEEPVVVSEKLTPPQDESDKPHVKLKKKKVRAMFDNISFDDI
jgi:cell division protein ZapA (FtsZ GTPase activity inhibitor)